MPSTGDRAGGRLCDEGSYPYAVNDSVEVQRSQYGRIFEGQVSDTHIQGISEGKAQLHRPTFFGERILCEYSGLGRADDSRVHQESGAGRKTPGANETGWTLTIAPSGGFHHTTRSAGSF